MSHTTCSQKPSRREGERHGKSLPAALLAFVLTATSPASAEAILSITGTGSVTVGATCGPPPFFDCPLTANGTAVEASALFGPWTFTSPFTLFSANPISATVFRNGGTFYYDDPSAANNDFFGTFTGRWISRMSSKRASSFRCRLHSPYWSWLSSR